MAYDIQTIPPTIALNFGINLIFYGEDGEVEYGGSTETADNPIYNFKYMRGDLFRKSKL